MAKHFFSLADSDFKEAILQSLDQRSSIVIIISAVLYVNVVSVLAVALAANSLPVNSTAIYLAVAFSFIVSSAFIETFFPSHVFSRLIASFFESMAIISSLMVNAYSIKQVSPAILVVSICMVTFMSLPISVRSFRYLVFSKGSIVLACIVYIFLYNQHTIKFVYIIFPLIIVFFLMVVIIYWLYIRQVVLLNQQFEANELKNLLNIKNKSLKEARDKLKREHDIRDKMIRHIGHDLRQPINTLSYSLFNMGKTSLNDSQIEHLDIAKISVDTANYMIEDILQISTYQKDDVKAVNEPFAVDELLKILQREYQSIAHVKGISLSVNPCSLVIEADIRLVSRILRNFLSNAIRHSQSDKIVVGARRRRQSVDILVMDQGVGVPSNLQMHLFNEFFSQTVAHNEGSFGLGLSIAQNLANACNAHIALDTKEGRGTTCILSLPI